MIAGPSWNNAQRLKNSSGKRQSKPQELHVSPQPTSSLTGVPQPAGGEREGHVAPEGAAERGTPGPRCQGASGNKLFLAFQSLRIIKEDADEDSASDLSDSERVPMSPSPLSPPDLRLRAEEIDPVHFDVPPGRGHARPEASYPDFLPAPFSSWDLRDMALLLHSEQRPGAVPRAGGPLGRFVDRLIQLEWLQMRTVQGERAKAAKAKAPAAPGPAAAPRSPGRGKPTAGAVSRAPQGAAPKPGPARKRGCPREEGRAPGRPFQTPPEPLHVLSGSRLCSQKQTLDPRAEDKKKKASRGGRQPRWDPGDADSGPKIESSGNIRALKHSAMILDAVDSRKAPKTQAHANLKKKGNANSCGHAPLSSEKKLKTNGGKQSARKFQ
ncbi:protein FAM217B isoform X2 [Pteropus medius]|nr:protein FAM217B isoform X2 [Pteropus giganteus]XP_039720668.1 protein FAM217B isoform X2 [Pteropus giganteus]